MSALPAEMLSGLDFTGASITRGFRAGLSLEARYKRQLLTEPLPTQMRINSMRTIIALDYFFVTNFTGLQIGTDQDFIHSLEAVLSSWLAENDVVIIGLLPVESELSNEMRAFIHSERGRPFVSPFALIGSCCAPRAAIVNRRLRDLASSNRRIYLFDWSNVIESYRLSPQLLPAPSELFADRLHINRIGQRVLYNLQLKSLLEQVWGVSLRSLMD